jgi:hypothetical protein
MTSRCSRRFIVRRDPSYVRDVLVRRERGELTLEQTIHLLERAPRNGLTVDGHANSATST